MRYSSAMSGMQPSVSWPVVVLTAGDWMYELLVFRPGEQAPQRIEVVNNAAEAMAALPRLLQEHAGCHRIEVHSGRDRLFAVDGEGRRLD